MSKKQPIIECIPNFSTSDPSILKQILASIQKTQGIILLDHTSDTSHNRSVVTFAGPPQSVVNAAFQSIKKASELIDLNLHKGIHPRMGATDVCPLVPISNISMRETVDLTKHLGERVGTELKIPVYLYESSADTPERVDLASVRQGQYEGIKEEIGKLPHRDPDFGPKELGPAGCIAIGAREPLIAYNVNLDSTDISIAKAIAKEIREKDGGLPNVKALGFAVNRNSNGSVESSELPIPNTCVQVSMNLTNYKITNVHTVFNAIKKLAKKYKVKILESELIGLIPEDAIIKTTKSALKLTDFKKNQILEIQLREAQTEE